MASHRFRDVAERFFPDDERASSIPGPAWPWRRIGLISALLVMSLGLALCPMPNPRAQALRRIPTSEIGESLESPIPSEDKRRAMVAELYSRVRAEVAVLQEAAKEEGQVGDDARLILERLRESLDD